MKVELIATDVDGTLIADDHLTIPQKNIEAFKEAKEKGIVTVISTGRCYALTDRENDMLGGVDYIILSNGASVMDVSNKEIINNCYLPNDTVKKILKIFEKYPLVYEIYADSKGYINQYTYDNYFNGPLPRKFMEDYRTRMTRCGNLLDIADEINVEKFNIDYMPKECIEPLKEELSSIENLVYSAGFEGNMEITAKGADKGKALAWLCNRLNIDLENVLAFGDSGNDVTMLKTAGLSYALSSGHEIAKKAARFVTKSSNEKGGVGEIIKEYLTNLPK